MSETETVEIVHIVPPGKSLLMRLLPTEENPKGGRVTLTPKTVVKAGRYAGVDEKEMEAMVLRGELVRVPLGADHTVPNAQTTPRTPHINVGADPHNPEPVTEPKPGPPLKRDLDPAVLREQVAAGTLTLDQLNLMVRERDQSMPPFDQPVEAIHWLSEEHDGRPPAPPAAPTAPPPPPQG